MLDIKLIVSCIGISNIKKAMKHESKIKELQPKKLMYYLWFIGVYPDQQNKGIGSSLIKEVIEEAHSQQRPVYLETSTLKNILLYEKYGFKIYNESNLGCQLLLMKKE